MFISEDNTLQLMILVTLISLQKENYPKLLHGKAVLKVIIYSYPSHPNYLLGFFHILLRSVTKYTKIPSSISAFPAWYYVGRHVNMEASQSKYS